MSCVINTSCKIRLSFATAILFFFFFFLSQKSIRDHEDVVEWRHNYCKNSNHHLAFFKCLPQPSNKHPGENFKRRISAPFFEACISNKCPAPKKGVLIQKTWCFKVLVIYWVMDYQQIIFVMLNIFCPLNYLEWFARSC